MTREGGSIPVTLTLQEATGKNVMLLPLGACDDGAHSQNEKMDRKNYIEGVSIAGNEDSLSYLSLKVWWSSFQFSVESNFAFALVLLYWSLWLVGKTRSTFLTNEKRRQNRSWLGRTRFPALGAGCIYLLPVLIGSLRHSRLLWLVRVTLDVKSNLFKIERNNYRKGVSDAGKRLSL